MSIINRRAFLPGSFVLWLVLVGVHDARHISYYDDNTVLQPIVTRSQERRICTELCMSGLGGTPCGEDCVDLAPQGLPLQSVPSYVTGSDGSDKLQLSNDTAADKSQPRTSACPILCKNQLGFPLCNCDEFEIASLTPNLNKKTGFVGETNNNYGELIYPKRVDFLEICGFFCLEYDYQLYGCQACEMFKKFNESGFDIRNWSIGSKILKEDWKLWCSKKCSTGDGGAACNCDLLPMALSYN